MHEKKKCSSKGSRTTLVVCALSIQSLCRVQHEMGKKCSVHVKDPVNILDTLCACDGEEDK